MAEKRNIIVTLMISGAIAALGASFLYLTDFEQWSCTSSAVPAMGFNGIAAAFLGGLNPIGTIFSSYFIQHITNGGAFVDKTMYCSQISDLISSIIIYLCGFVFFIKYAMNYLIDKNDEKKALKAKADAEAKTQEGGDK
jgi:simple sugar transport system permease protein